MASQTLSHAANIVGTATPRIDGPLKTTGAALYAADYHFEHMAHAVPVGAAIASGRIRRLDASAAEQMPGVLVVLHHGNIGPLYRTVPGDDNATNSEVRSAFEDEVIRHWGQHVAVVVAETLEQATAAAAAVQVEYEPQATNLRRGLDDYAGPRKSVSKRGDPDAAFAAAPVKVDETYITPIETHNPIELHASVAVWDGDHVTLYETTQGVVNHRVVMAQVLGLPVENVRVVTRFLGSGFGGKLFPLAAYGDDRGSGAQAESTSEAEPESAHDVCDGGVSSADGATHQAGCDKRRQAAGAAPRLSQRDIAA